MQGSLSQRFGFLLAAAGLGLCGYAGLQWYQLPRYSEDDLKASAELNLQLDLAREGLNETKIDPEELQQRRRQVTVEVAQEITKQRRQLWSWLLAGMALIVAGSLRLLVRSTLSPR